MNDTFTDFRAKLQDEYVALSGDMGGRFEKHAQQIAKLDQASTQLAMKQSEL